MQSSQSSGGPSILRCPHCGAPLEAAPFASMTRCGYCGHSIKLAEPSAPRPSHPYAHPPTPAPVAPARAVLLIVLGVILVLGLGAAVVGFLVFRGAAEPAATAKPGRAAPEPAPATPAVAAAAAPAPAAPKPAPVGYPLRSLLNVNVAVDIDGSSAHMRGLFPDVEPSRVADQLRFAVPLQHPWFGEAEFSWKNEKAGKLVTVGFRPPLGKDKLTDPKRIADCLSKGLGKPEAREIDHLSGEMSYFFGKGFPKAWANVYSGYVWLAFEDPRGVPPVTLAQVVRTFDGCAP